MTAVKPVLEGPAQAFADANSTPPFLCQLPPAEGRRIAEAVQTDPPPTLVAADVSDLTVQGGPTGSVREAYAAKLRTAGVPVTAVRYGGIIHDFVGLDPLRRTFAAQGAITQGIAFLSRVLGTD